MSTRERRPGEEAAPETLAESETTVTRAADNITQPAPSMTKSERNDLSPGAQAVGKALGRPLIVPVEHERDCAAVHRDVRRWLR